MASPLRVVLGDHVGQLADAARPDRQHKALRLSGVRPFVLCSLRHTFLTRLGKSGCDA